MLNLTLAAVDRGEVRIREEVQPDDPMWAGSGVTLAKPLHVDFRASSVGEGILVRGSLRTTVRLECRRCLEEVEHEIDENVDLLFEPLAGGEEDEADGEVYPLPERGTELDLTAAVREQLLLHVPQFVLCREDCKGLCAHCGTDLNQGACDCVSEPAPSPWDALKKLKTD
jgi:uncharacterized protein